jgi:hypothetical protein
MRAELYRIYTPEADVKHAQRLIRKAGKLKTAIREAVLTIGGMRYWKEEVAPNCGYALDVKPIAEQLILLMRYFPYLDPFPTMAYAKKLPQLPEGAEGWFVIPKPEKIARHFWEALDLAFEHLTTACDGAFTNCREGKIGSELLRPTDEYEMATEKLSARQPGDFWIIPAQLGIKHCGRSTRRAQEMFAPREFGLGPYEASIVLLTHPELLQKNSDLRIDCPSARFKDNPNVDPAFVNIPCFAVLSSGELHFGSHCVSHYNGSYGTATGFLL